MIDPAGTTGQVQAIRDSIPPPSRDSAIDTLADRLTVAGHDAIANLRKARTIRHDSAPPGATRVLLVDDDPSVLRAMKRSLVTLVDFVDTAPSITLAQKKAECVYYDLLIIDYQLANGTARELIQGIRDASKRPLVWIILVSGWLSKDSGAMMARDVNANDWVAKPVDLNSLQDAVNRGLAATVRARKVSR